MLGSINRTRLLLFTLSIFAVGLLVSGCGYDPREPVYDTKVNPKGFPQKAIDMLDGIEAGRLKTYDGITDSFAGIYMAHPGLLGSKDWEQVVRRLGARLVYRADRLVSDGLLQFGQAAEFYRVAAEIRRKEDTALSDRAQQFEAWSEFASDSLFDPHRLQGEFDTDYRIDLLTRFALIDSVHHAFARDYLAPELFPESAADLVSLVADRPMADRALLASVTSYPGDTLPAQASFVGRSIELVAWRLAPLADTVYRFEAYFRTDRPIERKLGVSLRVETPDTNLPADKQPVFPYDFEPLSGSDGWTAGQIAVATRTFAFTWPISAVRIGLFEDSPAGPVELQPDNTVGRRVRFPVAAGN